MDAKHIVAKKAKGGKLSNQEICFMINEYSNNNLSDNIMSAFIAGIYSNNLSNAELFYLTEAMQKSGTVLDLSDIGKIADKHSTGGVSDTTTLALVPICACLGVKMIKLSGRGLGHTGGTIDKLEAFKGFNANIDIQNAKKLIVNNGACIMSSTENLAPADKKIYALRDSIGLVDNVNLIASSVMSKKLASGADVIVLDVKYGNGAFMKTKAEAHILAKKMKTIGKMAGKHVSTVLSDMREPLGFNIGPMLEAHEAIEVLRGKSGKLLESVINLSTIIVAEYFGIKKSVSKQQVLKVIYNGEALLKFKQIVSAQGASCELFNTSTFTPTLTLYSNATGKVTDFKTQKLGEIVGQLGSSRKDLNDEICYNVGIKTFHKIGDKISKGDKLLEIFAKNKQSAENCAKQLINCIKID